MTTVLQNGLLTITGPGTGILGGGEGSTFDINGVDAITINTIGSEIVIRAGNPTGTAKGGDISIESGDGNTSGDIIISTGIGGSGKGDITFDSTDGEITLLCDTGSIFINGDTINLKVRTLDTLRFPSENGFVTRYLKIGSISSGVVQLKWASTNTGIEIRPPNPGGRVVTQTWTARSASEANDWFEVAWSSELRLFCAVARGGTVNRVMTSPNGITWTARTPPEANGWISIVWSPQLGIFCAVADGGTSRRAMTSIDGINWIVRETPSGIGNNWRGIEWSPELGLFCAVASTGTQRVMTSPDGIIWTKRTPTTDAVIWVNVKWSPELGLFAAISFGSDEIMTSTNGVTWLPRVAPISGFWIGLTWSPELGIFCSVGQTSINSVMTSRDGITWLSRTSTEDNQWNAVTWSPDAYIFCAIAQTGTNRIMVSTDGINWASRSATEDNSWISIVWSPELEYFVAISRTGINRVMTSLV